MGNTSFQIKRELSKSVYLVKISEVHQKSTVEFITPPYGSRLKKTSYVNGGTIIFTLHFLEMML